MGLRLVASYFDRSEAYVAWSALNAAGMPAFLHGADVINFYPMHEISFFGYRLVVHEDDVADAVSVLGEARRGPVGQGERLVTHHYFATFPLSLFLLIFIGLPMPLRTHSWRDLD